MKLFRLLVVLIGIFFISVYFRIPYIEKEISPYNETSVTVLTFFENWRSQGVAKNYFAPVQTWPNEGDNHISNYKRLEDARGKNYYVSYPPFAFLFSYAISSILLIEPGQVFLQILNIIMHFISAFFIYLIICRYRKCHYSKMNIPAIAGFVSYTFMPVLLFIHTFDFFSEMMGQVFFIIGIYLFQHLYDNKEKYNKKLLVLFGINLFVLIYTEWTGIFFSFTLLLISVIKFRKEIFYRRLFRTVFIFSLSAVAIILFQYAYISGLENLIRSLSLRFLERSGFFGIHYSDLGISYNNAHSYLLLFKQLHQTLIGFGYIAIILLIWWLFKNKFPLKKLFFGKTLIIIILLPIILEFFVFFNATLIHYICWAKFGIPLSIGIALMIHYLNEKAMALSKFNLWSIGVLIVLVGGIIFSVISFKTHAIEVSQKDEHLAFIGSVIKQNSGPDESVFVSLPDGMKRFNTYFCYISKRNIMNVENYDEADKILKEKQKVRGVFYTFDVRSSLYTVKHIDLTTPQR